MEYSRRSDFTPHLNTIFDVHPAGRRDTVSIELVEILEKSGAKTESFSLLFRGSDENVFGHDTHIVTHPVLGEFELFIGPVMYPKIKEVCYQAVFSKLK